MARYRTLDVSDVIARGGEPLPRILEAVGSLGAGEGLRLVAPFLPSPLIERLGSDGFAHRIEHLPGSAWVVYFWRDDGTE